ncbi:MAG: hypothetical protein ACI91T_001574, partial [Natronomonas sp.]
TSILDARAGIRVLRDDVAMDIENILDRRIPERITHSFSSTEGEKM